MKSNQKLLIMFWLKRSKATKDGQAPLYARITIEGVDEEVMPMARIFSRMTYYQVIKGLGEYEYKI